MSRLSYFTQLFVALLPGFLGLADLVLDYFGANQATISWVLLENQSVHRFSAACFAYTFGLLAGHLYLAATGQSLSVKSVLLRLGVCLLPTLLFLVTLAWSPLNVQTPVPRSGPAYLFLVGGEMVLSFGIGLLTGHKVLPQHPWANGAVPR